MTARTSLTHPLQIAEVTAPGAKGAIGITFCPGKKQSNAMSGAWDRDLGLDLDAIRPGAPRALSHLSSHTRSGREGRGHREGDPEPRHGLAAHADHRRFGSRSPLRGGVARARRALISAIRGGQLVLVHCKGGLGRAGTVAALMLVELGLEPQAAITAVRKARKRRHRDAGAGGLHPHPRPCLRKLTNSPPALRW